jgi:hypothetical protein
MPTVEDIQTAFELDRVLYSQHALQEMRSEPLGRIREHEVTEAIENLEELEDYPDDEPNPSTLFLGRTAADRPLHLVISYDVEAGMAIVVTIYEPDPTRWVDDRWRKS